MVRGSPDYSIYTVPETGEQVTISLVDLIKKSTTPVIYNVTMTSANTEYYQALPANCKMFMMQTRDRSAFRLAYETGKVAGSTAPYQTILEGDVYYEVGNELSEKTAYFASSSSGKIIEIIAWS